MHGCLEAVSESFIDVQLIRCNPGRWLPLWLGRGTTYDLLVRHRGRFRRILKVDYPALKRLHSVLYNEAAKSPNTTNMKVMPAFPEAPSMLRFDPWSNYAVELLTQESHALQLFFHALLEDPAMHSHPTLLRFVDLFGSEESRPETQESDILRSEAQEPDRDHSFMMRGEAQCHWPESS